MKECDAVKILNHGRDNARRTGRAALVLASRRLEGLWAAPVVLLAAIIFVSPAQAQPPTTAPDCSTGRELITIPEVKRGENGKLKAVLMLSDEYRSMSQGNRCMWQHLRYFKGWNAATDPPPSWPSKGEPIPGPTFRAHVGDLIQISFMNQIDTKNFPTSLDQGDLGKTTLPADAGETPGGCDEAFGTAKDPQGKTIKVNIYPRNNKMPNCLHGSSTSNVHFHGTHTTPSTTGDNVLLYIRPALRVKGQIDPPDAKVRSAFDEIFNRCENNGSPTKWTEWDQLASKWPAEQERLLKKYDETAPYRGQNGALPPAMKLWPKNAGAIAKGKWPQYSVGAFPYCFRLPDYDAAAPKLTPKVKMGQTPGTHWYHAHKHGSTALNVGNGMSGAFIIEGKYDQTLREFYRNAPGGLKERVLVIQQLETSLNMLSSPDGAAGPAPLSVNGRRQPVIEMRPGEVQMWRIVNGAPRSFVQFFQFDPPPATKDTKDTENLEWRQIAQDGVQFHPDNYERVGTENAQFNMAAANRVDLLVRAPEKAAAGSYALQVVESVAANPDPTKNNPTDGRKVTLLTVKVAGDHVTPSMDFIEKSTFPNLPAFLEDIPAGKYRQRKLVFDTTPSAGRGSPPAGGDLPEHTVDGELFDNEIKQQMVLDSVEEWTVVNKAVRIAHPFHIHINPFQVVEVFDPNSAEASDVNHECYADPKDPATWNPETRKPSCTALKPPFIWWDVLAIPSARNKEWLISNVDPKRRVDCVKNEEKPGEYKCPSPPGPEGASCSFNKTDKKQQCTVTSAVTIPGYFKMRSRFADFPGVFVQHCHILAHEDIGMMQLVEVCRSEGECAKELTGFTHY